MPVTTRRHRRAARDAGVAVIAEVKRIPVQGDLADDHRPGVHSPAGTPRAARRRSRCSPRGDRFGGSLDDLRTVRARVDLPVLRKDFIVSSYQLWEARAAGADLVLLIVAALEQPALVSLVERAVSLGLTPLVEVHDVDEVRASASTPGAQSSA